MHRGPSATLVLIDDVCIRKREDCVEPERPCTLGINSSVLIQGIITTRERMGEEECEVDGKRFNLWFESGQND